MWLAPTNPYSAYSDPSRVFDFFDHFDTPTLDPALWNTVYLNAYTISNSILTTEVGGLVLASPLPFNVNDGYAGEVRARMTLNANAYSGTLPEFSSSPSTRGSNADSDATVLYMRQINSQNLVVFIGDGSTNNYNIVSGTSVASTIDGTWYLAGVGVNSTAVALWLNDPQNPVAQYGGITWAKNMRYLVLGAFNAADGGASYDIQDTEYDWVRVRKWVFPEPAATPTGGEVEVVFAKLYVRNLGKEDLTLDRAYVRDLSTGAVIATLPLTTTVIPPGGVEVLTLSFNGTGSDAYEVILTTREGAQARFTASP